MRCHLAGLWHGRVSLLVAMARTTLVGTGKLPGYLAPAESLRGTRVSGGPDVASDVPTWSWAQEVVRAVSRELFCDPAGDDMQGPDFGEFNPPELARVLGSTGCWDPVGAHSDSSTEDPAGGCRIELKYGRVSMLVTMGRCVELWRAEIRRGFSAGPSASATDCTSVAVCGVLCEILGDEFPGSLAAGGGICLESLSEDDGLAQLAAEVYESRPAALAFIGMLFWQGRSRPAGVSEHPRSFPRSRKRPGK